MRSTIRCLFVILPDPQQVTSIAVVGKEEKGKEEKGKEGGEGGEGEGGR